MFFLQRSSYFIMIFLLQVPAVTLDLCGSCEHGSCDAVSRSCDCPPGYLGNLCQFVDLSSAEKSVASRTAVFLWQREMSLKNYKFAYCRHVGESISILNRDVAMYRKGAAKLIDLHPEANYTICLVHRNHTSSATLSFINNGDSKYIDPRACVNVLTMHDVRQTYYILSIVSAVLITAFPAIMIILHIIFNIRNKTKLTISHMPKIEGENPERILFDFLDGTLNITDARNRIVFRTVFRQDSTDGGNTEDYVVDFFTADDRREVYNMAKLHRDAISVTGDNLIVRSKTLNLKNTPKSTVNRAAVTL